MKNSPSMKSSAASGAALVAVAAHGRSGAGRGLGARFFVAHAWIPLIVVRAAMVLWTMVLGGDQWLADRLYAWQGDRWQLRHDFVTEQLIHRLGRDLSTMAWLTVLAAWIVARTRPGWVRAAAAVGVPAGVASPCRPRWWPG